MIVLRWILSLLFIIQMYLMMLVIAVVFAPFAIFSRNAAYAACKSYAAWVVWTLRVMCGITTEVRGTPPQDEVLVAAKHQSFYDILVIFLHLPRAKFIMKKELIYAPLLGQYALRIGCVPVDRGRRGAAITKMKADVARGAVHPGQLVIYPQGTRVAPGEKLSYKMGPAVLYQQLDQPCVPVATNIGLFWPKRGILRKPGNAVVEFLPRIETGLDLQTFTAELETRIETASDALNREAGFTG